MEERKWAGLFSFGWTRVNTLLYSQPAQAISSFHGVTLPQNQRTLLCTQQRRQMLLYLWTAKEEGREGGRERDNLCAFSASPSPQRCALPRCKVTLSSYMCRLKDYKTESWWKLMAPFFSPPVYGAPIDISGCSLYRLISSRSEEMERLFTCQPQSSGCVVSPAAADDSLTP